MTREDLLATKIVRAFALLWFIAFPIVFITIPVIEIMRGERAFDLMPVYAFALWILGPLAFVVFLRWFFPSQNAKTSSSSGG